MQYVECNIIIVLCYLIFPQHTSSSSNVMNFLHSQLGPQLTKCTYFSYSQPSSHFSWIQISSLPDFSVLASVLPPFLSLPSAHRLPAALGPTKLTPQSSVLQPRGCAVCHCKPKKQEHRARRSERLCKEELLNGRQKRNETASVSSPEKCEGDQLHWPHISF